MDPLPIILSALLPGLGQLIQGRIGAAVGHFLASVALWCLGWFALAGLVMHVYSAWEAWKFQQEKVT